MPETKPHNNSKQLDLEDDVNWGQRFGDALNRGIMIDAVRVKLETQRGRPMSDSEWEAIWPSTPKLNKHGHFAVYTVVQIDISDAEPDADLFDDERYKIIEEHAPTYGLAVLLADAYFERLNKEHEDYERWAKVGYDVRVYNAKSKLSYVAHTKIHPACRLKSKQQSDDLHSMLMKHPEWHLGNDDPDAPTAVIL